MKLLLSTNIYEPKGCVLVCGTCLRDMEPAGFAYLEKEADFVYSLCLEESHINTAITKLGAMLSTGRVSRLIFASVDRSPHCTQLHYIDHELRRMMDISIEIAHYVVVDDQIYPVSQAAIEQSKTLRTMPV